MKYYILAGSLLLSVCLAPKIARANDSLSMLQIEQNLSSKEGNTCSYVRGCGRRDKV